PFRRGVVDTDVAGVPFADPEPTLRVRPNAPGALFGCRRLVDGRPSGFEIDVGEIAAGQRHEPDVAAGGGRDAIGSAPARGIPDLHVTCVGVEPAIDAVLP